MVHGIVAWNPERCHHPQTHASERMPRAEGGVQRQHIWRSSIRFPQEIVIHKTGHTEWIFLKVAQDGMLTNGEEPWGEAFRCYFRAGSDVQNGGETPLAHRRPPPSKHKGNSPELILFVPQPWPLRPMPLKKRTTVSAGSWTLIGMRWSY